MSDSFEIKSGVKQDRVLALTLFGIFFAVLLKHAFGTATEGVYIRTEWPTVQPCSTETKDQRTCARQPSETRSSQMKGCTYAPGRMADCSALLD